MTAKPLETENEGARKQDEACSETTDRNAPAGSRNSLGAKSDCGGRPATDDSVVEAKDEMGPGVGPDANEAGEIRRKAS